MRAQFYTKVITSIFICLFILTIFPRANASSNVIGTSTSTFSISYPFQRKIFYAASRFWAYYSDGTNMVWESTTDPADWSNSPTSIGAKSNGYSFSIFFDGTYVHYARSGTSGNYYVLYYRRGTPNSNGTITYSANEQTVYSGLYNDYYEFPQVAVDDAGYAWIGARYRTITSYYPYALKNANNDGTWSTASSTKLHTTSDTSWVVSPIPLTSQKMYVIYASAGISGGYAYGKLYSGSFGSQETCDSYAIQVNYGFSATNEGDNVHFSYLRYGTYQIRYRFRTYGSSPAWGTDTLVQNSVDASTCPVLSIETSTYNVYCFWMDKPTADHIYYAIRYSSNSSWSGAVDWIDESSDTIVDGSKLTCFYESYSGYIGLVYTTKSASPYNIKFAYLTISPIEEWHDIATWTFNLLTRQAQTVAQWSFNLQTMQWNSITTLTFSLLTRQWQEISSWLFNLATLGWHTIAYWLFDLPSRIWTAIASWNFDLLTRTWQNIATFTFSLLTRLWQTIATISFSLIARIWQNIMSWSFSLATMMWNTISQWIFDLATLGWNNIASWTFDLGARAWQNTASWLFSLTSRSWETIATWTFNLVALGWHLITVWIFTLLPQLYRVFPFIMIFTGFLLIVFTSLLPLLMIKLKKRRKESDVIEEEENYD